MISQSSSYRVQSASPSGAAISGVGLHTGNIYQVQLELDSRLQQTEFVALYRGEAYTAPASWTRLSGTSRATALVLRGAAKRRFEIKTVEHFLAAVSAFGFPGLRVSLQIEKLRDAHSPVIFEMPCLDGSSVEWCRILGSMALPTLKTKKVWVPVRSTEIRDGDRRVRILPHEEAAPFTVWDCSVDFGAPYRQSLQHVQRWDLLNPISFTQEIAPARTFGMEHEVQSLLDRGLALGGSLDNALVLGQHGPLNARGFLISNELAAHKILDAIGDFALLGGPILGRLELHRAGHHLHLRALEEAVKSGAIVEAQLDVSGQILR